ncbi:hypothetical protein H257_16858 [Aphanomyces astaci]|uniref:Cation efflux protein cytoplasmic domain-containing protein n=1 Tax=Aphanomyces astaci TaxID=112090 RepID=W4FGW7_APHAT|nr:hypothetical protein H257_16858 [Aphanomyces astaci]ETV66772.1 hypothetical protein H257_16858 [Aphanomyces astaci]|eukprot:XP_009843748.1 hypothetical protein H257_16858 [Aphanomyces astaci]
MAPHGHSHAGYGATNEATPLVSSPKKKSSIALSESSLRARKKLQWACLFSLVFMVAEVVGGFMAGSLAIMTDAAHLLSDVAGFCISLFAIWVQTLPASSKMTFGFHRAEILGAIVSVLVIWVLTGFLVYAAIERFQDAISDSPQEHVDGKLMFIVAVLGLVVNLALMKILGHSHSHGIGGASHGHSHGGNDDHHDDHHGHSHGGDDDHHGHSHGHDEEHGHGHNEPKKQGDDNGKPSLENLNIQAAYIHALGDFIQSLGVCIAGALIWYNPKWQVADPVATFLFSILVLYTTVGIIRSSVHVLMEGTPEGFDVDEILHGLETLPSVSQAHDLHIWSLNAGLPSLSVHLVTNSDNVDDTLHEAQNYLISKDIHHSTIQVERALTTYPRDCSDTVHCGQLSPK